MRMRLLALAATLLLLAAPAFAARAGDQCDYAVYGDSQCDPRTSLYCINFQCAVYSGGTSLYCTDPDADDRMTAGTTAYRYREANGAFVEGAKADYCERTGVQVGQCAAGADCSVREFVCGGGTPPYSSSLYQCTYGCGQGACLPAPTQTATPTPTPAPSVTPTPTAAPAANPKEGDACNYWVFGDAECNNATNGLYCVDGACKKLAAAPQIKCVDSDGSNKSVSGTATYSYRENDGGIVSGNKTDACSGTQVKEYSCKGVLPDSGETFKYDYFNCTNGCSGGACKASPEAEPQAKISDAQLLQYIEEWSNGGLGETEEENDAKIMEYISVWKGG
ncbi:MAG: hypothetical protein V1708_04370 [Candidatus Micrarchaeota archaeon]